MALYRARWTSQDTGRLVYKDFHSKAEAEAFRALPRDHLVLVERYQDAARSSDLPT